MMEVSGLEAFGKSATISPLLPSKDFSVGKRIYSFFMSELEPIVVIEIMIYLIITFLHHQHVSVL